MKVHVILIWSLIFVTFGATLADESPEDALFKNAPTALTAKQLNRLKIPFRPTARVVEERATIEEKLRSITDEKEKTSLQQRLQELNASNTKSLGLFLPTNKFHLGEPSPAYFVLKNNTRDVLPLDMRLDLHFGDNTSNSCSVKVECVKVAEGYERLESVVREHVWRCGGPPLVRAPASGYYCVRADLQTLGANAPGEYRAHWVAQGAKSQEVTFTILPPRKTEPTYRPVTSAAIAKIGRDPDTLDELVELIEDEIPPPVIEPAVLSPRSFLPTAATFSVGANGVIYPDIFHLPSSDRQIFVTAHFDNPKKERLPKELVLTLTPKQKNKDLILEDYSHIYLLAFKRGETEAPEHAEVIHRESMRRMRIIEEHSLADPAKPLTIRMKLTDDWPQQLGLTGNVELRVIIASERIKPQGYGEELKELREESRRIDTKPWSGLLCTPSISLHISDMNSP